MLKLKNLYTIILALFLCLSTLSAEIKVSKININSNSISLNANIPGTGRVKFQLKDTGKNGENVSFYKGQANTKDSTSRAFAALWDQELHISFTISNNNEAQLVKILIPLNGSETATLKKKRQTEHKCESVSIDLPDAPARRLNTKRLGQRTLNLAVVIDSAWQNKFKNNSNDVVKAIINEAEFFYHDTFDLHINIEKIILEKELNFAAETAAGSLKVLRSYVQDLNIDDVDAFHLFSGARLNKGAIGIAYVAPICRSLAFSVGITSLTSSLITPVTFAHELAHNLGAQHAPIRPLTLMSPSVGAIPPNSWAESSIDQVSSHINRYSTDSCLNTQETQITTASNNNSKVNLKVGLNRKNKFFHALIEHNIPGICEAELLLVKNKKELAGKVLAQKESSTKQITFFTTLKNGLKLNTKNKKKIFLKAKLTCENNQTYFSKTKRIKVHKIKGLRKVGYSMWANLLGLSLK